MHCPYICSSLSFNKRMKVKIIKVVIHLLSFLNSSLLELGSLINLLETDMLENEKKIFKCLQNYGYVTRSIILSFFALFVSCTGIKSNLMNHRKLYQADWSRCGCN